MTAEDNLIPAEGTTVPMEQTVAPVEQSAVASEEQTGPPEGQTLASEEQTVAAVEQTVEQTVTPEEQTAATVEQTVTIVEQTVASEEQTVATMEQTVTPEEQTTAPVEPTVTPEEQTAAPVEPTIAPEEQTMLAVEQAVVPVEEKVISEKIAAQNNCRHEYVRIYQRRLKGLDRRLVSTRAYLPVGFKVGDFGHLSEGSFCFCTKCRKRLFPKRSQGEKDQARLERQQAKIAGVAAAFATTSLMGDDDSILSGRDDLGLEDDEAGPFDENVDEDKMTVEVTVDELEVESVDVEDIKAEGVKLVAEDGFEESCDVIEDIDS